MQLFRTFFISVFLVITTSAMSHSQENKPTWFIGPYGAIMQSMHSTGFKDLPGYPSCCFSERSGTGIGYDIGMLLRFPINEQMSFRFFGGINTPGATISSDEKIGNQFIRNPQFPFDTIARDITVRHSIESIITQISARPMISYALPFGGDISAGIGLNYVLSQSFNQKETLISPDNAAFLDGKGTRNDTSGTIPDLSSFQTAVSVAYSYDLPISNTSLLVPFIEYHYPLQSLTSYDWNISRIQLGLALQFGIVPSKEPKVITDTVYRRDTIIRVSPIAVNTPTILNESQKGFIKGKVSNDIRIDTIMISETYLKTMFTPPGYKGDLVVYGLDEKGKQTSKPTIRIEEWEQIETFPLLPYIYFEEGSSDLGGTKQRLLLPSQAGLFNEDSLPSSTLDIYRDILNIIGSRAKASSASFDISGFTNTLIEDDVPGITLQRAKNIQSYMQSIWGISTNKMTINTGKLPRTPTNPSTLDGQQENARAEITSKDPNLLSPLKKRTITRTMNPPILAIQPKIQAGDAIKSWEIMIEDGEQIVQTFRGNGKIPDSTFTWTISPSSQMSNKPLAVKLLAIDTIGNNHSWNTDVQTERVTLRNKQELRINDTLIERFALILFDFDKSSLSSANQNIANTIKQSIKSNSTVSITGYTDRTGDSSYNQVLSEERCKQVSQYLGLSAGTYSIIPMGGKEIPFENDTPQGRAYSRTVMIEVKTPIKERK